MSSAKYGYLYQGQRYAWQDQPRGTPAFDLRGAAFVSFLENHDQVANSAFGKRHPSADLSGQAPGAHRADAPWPGDADAVSGPGVRRLRAVPVLRRSPARTGGRRGRPGRREFLAQFPSTHRRRRPGPAGAPADSEATFARCKLDLSERTRARRGVRAPPRPAGDPARGPGHSRQRGRCASTAPCSSPALFVCATASGDADDRLLVVNLGVDCVAGAGARAAAGAAVEGEWDVLWSSESPAYGGSGRAPLVPEDGWHVPGESALLLASRRRDPSAAQKPKRRAGGTPAAGRRRRTDGQTDG